jgi:peptidoglycan hydrolase-like protein with peptidoglycan-binding domain
MSLKVDTLLKKTTTFERLALYGDRKSFLQALAQETVTDDPSPWRIYDEPGDPRGQQSNWVPQITPSGRKYVYTGPAIPAGGVPHTPGLWEKYFEPKQNTKLDLVGPGGQRVPHNIGLQPDTVPDSVDRDPSILMQRQMDSGAVPEKAAPQKNWGNVNYQDTIKQMQNVLLQHFGPTSLGPTGADGRFGTETSKTLKKWQAKYNLPQTGQIDAATAKIMGLEQEFQPYL